MEPGLNHRFLPGLDVARSYRRDWISGDVVAGLTLTALLIPQGMAYAQLAGLPPVTGLYTTILGLIAYAIFGPSRFLVLGPDSALGPLIAAALVATMTEGAQLVAAAGFLAIMMGAMCVGAGLARLGVLSELLSRPVRTGYLNGIALVVLVSQLPKMFGFSIDAGGTVVEMWRFARAVTEGATHPATLTIGITGLGVILICRRWIPRAPGVLITVVGATLAVSGWDLAGNGVAVVGPVPAGVPAPSFPVVAWGDIGTLMLAAVGLAFVTLADTTALSRSFAGQTGEEAQPNQDMVALGAANIAAGLFSGFPLSASSSRTAVARTAGGHTQLVGVIGAVAISGLLFWGNRLTTHLATAALASIVVAAAFTLFDLAELRLLWRVRLSEFVLSAAATVGVVVFGVLPGIVVAVSLSLGDFLRRAWRPHDAVLVRLPNRKGYHDAVRHPEGVRIPGLVVYRFDAPLFFANAEHFARRVRRLVADREDPVRWVVLAAEPITDIDTTGAEVLTRVLADLHQAGIELAFAELKGPVKDRLIDYGLEAAVTPDRLFPTLGTAVRAYCDATGTDWHDPLDG